MPEGLLIASNIVIPTVSGIFFFVYFVYFAIVFHAKVPSFLYFVAFLLSFSVFLLGRPLQLLLGPHPVPLVIVNIRMVVFCTVTITTITIASAHFSNQRGIPYRVLVFAIGIALAAVYVTFNTLGTTGSYPVFRWGDTVAHDSLTPTGLAPFFGREVTIAVQVVIGLGLAFNSLYRMFTGVARKSWRDYLRDKVVLFNSGIFLFALTFTIGSFTKQWWLYYFASPFSALLFGAGVVLDIREIYNNYEKLIPIIKEDIIENVAVSRSSRSRLSELLIGLGRTDQLDTFAVLLLDDAEPGTGFGLDVMEAVTRTARRELDRLIGRPNYLLIPLNDTRLGVVFRLDQTAIATGLSELDLFQQLQDAVHRTGGARCTIGIGHVCADISELHTSYSEARHALEFAVTHERHTVVHADNIREDRPSGPRYPTNEKMRLLAAIKLGNPDECSTALDEFLAALETYTDSRPDSLRVRLYEIVGAFIDAAIASGGDEERLNALVQDWLREIEHIHSFKTAAEWLREIVPHIVRFVNRIRKSRSTVLVDKATSIIEERFGEQISYHDVAKELHISASYFVSLFKQETGATFVEYLTRVRIDRSKQLLIETARTITDIAYDVGFSNPNYFSSTFKKLTGVSAKTFRSQGTTSTARP